MSKQEDDVSTLVWGTETPLTMTPWRRQMAYVIGMVASVWLVGLGTWALSMTRK